MGSEWFRMTPTRSSWGRIGLPMGSDMLDFISTLYLTSMLFLGFNAFLHFNASSWFEGFPSFQSFSSLQCLTSVSRFPSLRRRGHIECDHVFLNQSPSISPQCFILVSMLSFTSKLYLGFNAFIALSSASLRWCPIQECPRSTVFQDVVSSRHRAG